ncbi:MAG TPA: hypothetical protein VIT64_05435 [Ilumatobacteraceae bacterium]
MSSSFPISIRTVVAAIAVVALTGLSACSGSDDDAADDTASATISSTADSTADSSVVTVAGSSSVPTTAGPTAPAPTFAPEDAELCTAAQRIAIGDAELNDEIQAAVGEAIRSGEIDPFATLLTRLRTEGLLDGIAEAYEDLEAAAPPEQQPNVQALAEYSAATFEQLATFDTVEEMQSWAENITSDPAAIAVQEPATAITEYVQETCGFSLAN